MQNKILNNLMLFIKKSENVNCHELAKDIVSFTIDQDFYSAYDLNVTSDTDEFNKVVEETMSYIQNYEFEFLDSIGLKEEFNQMLDLYNIDLKDNIQDMILENPEKFGAKEILTDGMTREEIRSSLIVMYQDSPGIWKDLIVR